MPSMTKAKVKASGKREVKKEAAGSGQTRTGVDVAAIREEITGLIASHAVSLVKSAIAEADNGHYAGMKFLFEMAGLYPATAEEEPEKEDSLARILLRTIGMESDPSPATAVTKDWASEISGGRENPVE